MSHPRSKRVVLLLLVVALLVICGTLYWRDANEIEKNIRDREARRTEIFANFYQQDIQSAIKELQQLLDGDGLQAFLLSNQPSDLKRAVHRAQFVSRLNPDYDQIRFLNDQGQEVIRIKANGTVVPPDQLQNESSLPFFLKANSLAPGQFFISAFDLNVEHNQLEQPPKPTIRIATPVFDANGHRAGIYVINYLGENIITRLMNFTPQYQDRLRILNADGYWIKSGNPQQEWGFMYPDRSGMTMAQTDPSVWKQMVNQPEGQLYHNGGLFTWLHVTITGAGNSALTVKADDKFIVIASEISPEEWNAYFTGLRETFLVVTVILLLLALASWQFFISRQQAKGERDRFFNLTRDMLCIAGFDGYFKRVNPAWTNTLGYTQAEMLARPFLDFVHPDDRERTLAETKSLAHGEETLLFENRYISKDGSYRWLLWSARSLVGEKLIFASARDLTDRKVIEEQLLKLNNELKHRAEELEVANKELEAFSYSVSHDLRAPLRHINGFVELLQKSSALQADEKSTRQMQVIAKAAKNMGLLIDDLLAFSRTGRVEMHLVKVDTREIIDQVIRELGSETKNRTIVWEIKELPQVFVDPPLFRLIWTNLIANAVKYTRPRATATIEIGHSIQEHASSQEVVFYIRDNGVGFDMKYSAKLFGVFQRFHRAEDFEGTGIGLANVERIVHRHHGRVWAEAFVDVGSTFFFSIPATSTK